MRCRPCSNLVADYNDGLLTDPAGKPAALDKLVRSRQPDSRRRAGWKAIDAAEIARGRGERPRDKFTAVADMLAAAAAPTPPVRRRLLAGCFDKSRVRWSRGGWRRPAAG